MKNILFAGLLILLLGNTSAYTIDLNVTGTMSPPYPMLFLQCNGNCSNVYVNYTARNHTTQPMKVLNEDTLFLELSGLPSATTEALPMVFEFTPSQDVIYYEYPLNLPCVDFPASMTISIDLQFPEDLGTTTTTLPQEKVEQTFFQTVGELLRMIGLNLS